jgi:hypothetical protein
VTAPPWWHGLGPSEIVVECSGERHAVRWQEGRLVAPMHPDVEGEETLAALAGERLPCLELLGLWAQHGDDPRVLVVASRGLGDVLVGAEPGHGRGWVAYAPLSGRSRPAAGRMYGRASAGGYRSATAVRSGPGAPRDAGGSDPLERLATLAGPLLDRLAGNVAAAWAERIESDGEEVDSRRALLDAALYGRVLHVIRLWTGDPLLEVTVEVIAPAEHRRISRRQSDVAIALPFSWVPGVWARGLSVVLDRFVLGATAEADGRIVLDAVDRDCVTRSPVSVAFPISLPAGPAGRREPRAGASPGRSGGAPPPSRPPE